MTMGSDLPISIGFHKKLFASHLDSYTILIWTGIPYKYPPGVLDFSEEIC